jgi:zona occludens toxin (predicted ATPase)
LVYSAQFNDINEAISWEKHIKRWSHAKKTALITADEKQLHDFSKCMNESHAENMEKDRRALSSRAETRDDLFRVMVRLRSP